MTFWSSLGPCEDTSKDRPQLRVEEQTLPPLPHWCHGEHARWFLLSEPSGFVPVPLPAGGCTVPVLEVEGRRTFCLSHLGRGMAGGSPHPTSSLRLKGLPMSARQFRCRIFFWMQTGPGFQLNPLCLLNICRNKSEDPKDVQTTTYSIAVLETGQNFPHVVVI